jgi:hypothetical protein
MRSSVITSTVILIENVRKWASHSRMSDPAAHAAAVADFPSEIGFLNGIVQGILVHSDWLTAYGLEETEFDAVSRTTLPIANLLDSIFKTDAQRVQIRRPPEKRAVGTCRDFALMLCSFLRVKGVPSRVRCGFAAYFGSNWEDHWVCEYWDEHARLWRLSDPQIDEMLKDRCHIDFDPTDVPRHAFATAGQVWFDCRAGRSDPRRFGHGTVTGSWFIKINVVRDHYALNGRETSAWDDWRAAPASKRAVGEQETALLDDLAAHPEQQFVQVDPDFQP